MDTSFIDLSLDENIKKIKIDERLIPAFKKTMRNFQEYFNYMGYTKERNYQEFFNKYLISKYLISNIKIECNNKPIRENAEGLYDYYKNKIIIDSSLLKNPRDVLDALTHEFIHFIVIHNVKKNNLEDNIINENYLNEFLTEMLKMQILPLTNESYKAYISIIKFWLILNNKELKFNDFLNKGKFYNMNLELKELLDNYCNSLNEIEHIFDAIKNPLYINIQRYLINRVNTDNINSLEEYELLISKLSKRPVKDIYFMNRYFKKVEYKLCFLLNINDKYLNRYLLYLKQYRELVDLLNNDNNLKYANTFYFYGLKYEIDFRRNVYIDSEFENKCDTLILDEGYDYYKFKLKKEYTKKIILSSKKLNLSKIRYKNKYNKQRDLIEKKKNYIKSILSYIKFINDNDIIEENIYVKS